MKTRMRIIALIMIFAILVTGCGTPVLPGPRKSAVDDGDGPIFDEEYGNELVESAVSFTHTLDNYKPKKKEYNFYFTYKMVHPWWDAVAMGLEDACDQYAAQGITINYDYLAPLAPSAADQKKRILNAAAKKEYDVIGVDVVDSEKISPVIDKVMKNGQKVITFSSSDADPKEHCKRIAYIGNTHNFKDGSEMAKILCSRINNEGKVGILVGDPGNPCHEDRLNGVKYELEKWSKIKIIGIEYDRESEKEAEKITEKFLDQNPDLAGLICCNMVNPVAAASVVKRHNLSNQVTIVGMDHDEHALKLMQVGAIYSLGVQDCVSIGFDTLQTAIKVADGVKPGKLYKEKTDEKTTFIYQKDAQAMLYKLYGTE